MQGGNISNFVFGDIQLSQVVFIEGIPHATRAAIGEWLEYADPQNAVDVILGRNPHIEEHSVPVNLTGTDGKNYDTSVYHPIGFLLIVMESGQPKAKEMKRAVAEFVWRYAGGSKCSAKERIELLKMRRALVGDMARTKDAFARRALMDDLVEVSLRLGQPVPNQDLLGKDASQLALPSL